MCNACMLTHFKSHRANTVYRFIKIAKPKKAYYFRLRTQSNLVVFVNMYKIQIWEVKPEKKIQSV